MQHAKLKPTRVAEDVAMSDALARLVELGLIDVDLNSVDETSPAKPMYRLSDRFTIASVSTLEEASERV
jgi:hypothetical protein